MSEFKKVRHVFLSGKLSSTLIIPIDIARRHGLDKPANVILEENDERNCHQKSKHLGDLEMRSITAVGTNHSSIDELVAQPVTSGVDQKSRSYSAT